MTTAAPRDTRAARGKDSTIIMRHDELRAKVYERLSELPILDAHTHLVDGKLAARGLHDVLLYHMAVSDLYAAGCPSGARLTCYPGWPSEQEAHFRIKEALPYLKYVRGTAISYGIRVILRDLYGIATPVDESNWEGIDAMIRERADDRSWQRQVIDKAHVKRICTEIARREGGSRRRYPAVLPGMGFLHALPVG